MENRFHSKGKKHTFLLILFAKLTTDAVEILYKRIIGNTADMKALLAKAESAMDIAEQIYNLRACPSRCAAHRKAIRHSC